MIVRRRWDGKWVFRDGEVINRMRIVVDGGERFKYWKREEIVGEGRGSVKFFGD